MEDSGMPLLRFGVLVVIFGFSFLTLIVGGAPAFAADDPKAAARTISGIYQKAQLLKQHSEIGHKYDVENSRSVRVLLYGHLEKMPLCPTDARSALVDSRAVTM